MGQSAEELRQEIAGTRADLGDTLDAIGDRVSPGRVMERRKNRMTNGLRTAKDRIFGSASDAGGAVADTAGTAVDAVRSAPDAAMTQTQGKPVVAGAVAFGVGFLVAAAFPPSEVEEQAASKVIDKAGAKRDGGSFQERMGKVACWNSVMDQDRYMVQKWNEFVAA